MLPLLKSPIKVSATFYRSKLMIFLLKFSFPDEDANNPMGFEEETKGHEVPEAEMSESDNLEESKASPVKYIPIRIRPNHLKVYLAGFYYGKMIKLIEDELKQTLDDNDLRQVNGIGLKIWSKQVY